MDRPNDRLKTPSAAEGEEADPKIYLVVNNDKFMRPGLETFFAVPGSKTTADCTCNPVVGVYCSCNKVCTCNPQCSCQAVKSCSCVGYTKGGGGRYCSCVPVH